MASWVAGKLTKPAFKQAFKHVQESYPDSQLTAHLAQIATSDNPMAPSDDAPFEVVGGNASLKQPQKGLKQKAAGIVETKAKTYALNKAIGLVWAQATLPLAIALWVIKFILGFVEDRRTAAARKFKDSEAHRADVARIVKQIKEKPAGKLLASSRDAESHMMRSTDSKKVTGPATELTAQGTSTAPTRSMQYLNLNRLNSVLAIDSDADTCLVEANCTFRDLLRATTGARLMPQVVPPFLDITVAGAFIGSAVGSTSWRKGAFADSVIEMTVALGSGEVITVTREGPHSSLFHTLHSSYHSLATLLSLKLQLVHAPRYLWQKYENFTSIERATARLNALLKSQEATAIEHMEMMQFSPSNVTLVINQGVETIDASKHKVQTFGSWWETRYASYVQQWSERAQSKNGSMPIKHCIPLMDFLGRFENGAFWQSEWMFAQLPWPLKGNSFISRLLFGWSMDAESMKRTIASSDSRLSFERTRIVQDALIPLHHLVPFLGWCNTTLKITPLYLCPVLGSASDCLAPNFVHSNSQSNSAHGYHYVQVGIYGQPDSSSNSEELNSALLQQCYEAGGRTMLYARNYHSRELFAKMYDRKAYEAVRSKYAAADSYPSLYEKIALSESDRAELSKPVEASAEKKVLRHMGEEVLLGKLKFWKA